MLIAAAVSTVVPTLFVTSVAAKVVEKSDSTSTCIELVTATKARDVAASGEISEGSDENNCVAAVFNGPSVVGGVMSAADDKNSLFDVSIGDDTPTEVAEPAGESVALGAVCVVCGGCVVLFPGDWSGGRRAEPMKFPPDVWR